MVSFKLGRIFHITGDIVEIASADYPTTSVHIELFQKHIELGRLYVFTVNDRGKVNYICLLTNYLEVIAANYLELSYFNISSLVNYEPEIFKYAVRIRNESEIKVITEKRRDSIYKSIDHFNMETTRARRYKPGEDNYIIYMIKMCDIKEPYLKQLVSTFKYDGRIEHYEDMSEYDRDYDGKKEYDNNVRLISIELRKFLHDNYKADEHLKYLTKDLLDFIHVSVKKMLIDSEQYHIASWKFFTKADPSYIDIKLLLVLITNYILEKYKANSSISRISSEFYEYIYSHKN